MPRVVDFYALFSDRGDARMWREAIVFTELDMPFGRSVDVPCNFYLYGTTLYKMVLDAGRSFLGATRIDVYPFSDYKTLQTIAKLRAVEFTSLMTSIQVVDRN